jgi:hypothetical protein
MSKSGGGVNRVCLPCRIKYPSKFTDDPKSSNVTSVCSECGEDLTPLHDSVLVPKKRNFKAWKKLATDIKNNTVITPVCSYNKDSRLWKEFPDTKARDYKLDDQANRQESRQRFLNAKTTHPDLVSEITQCLKIHGSGIEVHNNFKHLEEEDKIIFNIVNRHFLITPKDVVNQ